MRYTWTQLRNGEIAGVIDAYGAVHSKFGNSASSIFHEEEWPNCTHYRWRWRFNDGIVKAAGSNNLGEENWMSICDHIHKKYRIPFWENGYHDLDYFLEKLEKEEKSLKAKTQKKLKKVGTTT